MPLTSNDNSLQTWWLGLAVMHVVLWTLMPALLHHNAPLDVSEAIAWGQQWQWGYDRDPYLVGWLAYSVSWLTGHSVWAIYLLSQVCVLTTFWAVWRLAVQLPLSQAQALVAVFLLEGVFYYNFATPEFNDNVLQLPLWALTVSFLYSALLSQRLLPWLLTGLWAGLALMAKYYTIMLMVPILIVILGTATGRQSFKSHGIYSAMLVGLLIIFPNIDWQYQHGFQYVGWALSRAPGVGAWYGHLSMPLLFGLTQLLVLLPGGLLYFWIVRSLQRRQSPLTAFDGIFLDLMAWGPLLTTLAYAAVTGTRMHSMWGMPLFSFAGLWLVCRFWPAIGELELRRASSGALFSCFMALVIYSSSVLLPPYLSGHAKKVSYPAVELAELVEWVWHQHHAQALPFVAGTPRELAATVAVYSKEHPIPFFDWDAVVCPWVDIDKMRRQGAVFVWDAEVFGNAVPVNIRKAYPQVGSPTVFELAWHTKATIRPVRVGIALLPAAES